MACLAVVMEPMIFWGVRYEECLKICIDDDRGRRRCVLGGSWLQRIAARLLVHTSEVFIDAAVFVSPEERTMLRVDVG